MWTNLNNSSTFGFVDKLRNTAYMYEWNVIQLNICISQAVRQQNSGSVEDFILPYSAVYLRIKSERIIEIGPHLPKLS